MIEGYGDEASAVAFSPACFIANIHYYPGGQSFSHESTLHPRRPICLDPNQKASLVFHLQPFDFYILAPSINRPATLSRLGGHVAIRRIGHAGDPGMYRDPSGS